MKKNKNGLSLDTLLRHQLRIKELVKRINKYSPTFDKNSSYRRPSPSFFREKRSIEQDKLFQENFKIIQKIESAHAKVDTKHFPPIDTQKKKKHKSLKHKKIKSPPKYQIKNQEQLLDENLDLIQKIQTTQKKVDCWTSPVLQKSRLAHQKEVKLKRKEMIDRFNKISKQLRKIKHSQFVQKYHKNKSNVNELQIFSKQKIHSHMKTTSTYITGNRPSLKRQNTNF